MLLHRMNSRSVEVRTIEEKINLTVEWLRERVQVSGTRGILVGLSGGIDSSVVCYLIKKAFPDNSMGVLLPCKSHGKDREDALAVAKASGICYSEVELSSEQDSILNKVVSVLGEDFDKTHLRLTDANLRARMRMSTLYALANAQGYLVAGTDNAAEVYTGYYTKYGDGGVDILPIASLTKREVYQWAEVLGVPQSVIDRPPSAGLWEGQTDESEMGTTYTMIDDYLEGKEIPAKDQALIDNMHKRTMHKREMPPMAPRF